MCTIRFISISIALLVACVPAFAGQTMGEVTQVVRDTIRVNFPVSVRPHSVMVILTGEGAGVAGTAIVDKCVGDGPFEARGRLLFISNAEQLVAGKKAYVDSANVVGVPRSVCPPQAIAASGRGPASIDRDMNLYYYAGGQSVGYGALGLGYEHTLRLAPGIGIQADGGITGIGSVNEANEGRVEANQVIETLTGRLKLDFSRGMGVYGAYRWSSARGDVSRWDSLTQRLQGANFVAASEMQEGTVQLRGLEYGLTLRPLSKFSMSLGYVPDCRMDFGSLGVITEPGYSAELRMGAGPGAVRLRGLRTDDYWTADLGVTIR